MTDAEWYALCAREARAIPTCATCGDADHATAEHVGPLDAIPVQWSEVAW